MSEAPLEPSEGALVSTRNVLFLDYDGVAHRGPAYRTRRGIRSSSPSITLFEYTPVLAEILKPYPNVEIVLSTSWVKALGYKRARDALPVPELRQKVTGATYHSQFPDAKIWDGLARGTQILRYVNRHCLVNWLALDDRDDGFDAERMHLVLCNELCALGDRDTQRLLMQALHGQFGTDPGVPPCASS